MRPGKFNMIIGGQAGSEAKGKLSGWLCDKYKPDLLVMTASPNAGHTVVTPAGEKMVSYHLPVGSVMCECPIVLGPASLINTVTFKKEIRDLDIDPTRIYIHPRASIIIPAHIQAEESGRMSDIGSTLQGIGECRRSKLRRDGNHVFAQDITMEFINDIGGMVADTTAIINAHLIANNMVLCETTQGFDLDLEHGIDPRYCTSKMVGNPSMAMAEAGVPPNWVGDVYGVIRPYPIRVNNRTGTSGPYAEAPEIDWETVAERCGFPGELEDLAEITTTTKLSRRVFEFSWQRYAKFIQVTNPTHICLQFANYLDWDAYGVTDYGYLPPAVLDFVNRLEVGNPRVSHIGTGPGHDEMIEVGG